MARFLYVGSVMTTVSKIVTRALRKIGVIDAGESATAVDFETALEELNSMMIEWESEGTATGWTDVENPSDPIPVPREDESAIVYNLAVRLAPEWDMEAPGTVVLMASQLRQNLAARRLTEMPLSAANYTIAPSNGWYGYNVYYDGYGFRR